MREDEDLSCPPPGPAEEPGAEAEDYVFRFPLAEPGPDQVGYEDPLLELIRGQLADLLDVVVLTYRGKRVLVDGFRLLDESDTVHDIFASASGANAAPPEKR